MAQGAHNRPRLRGVANIGTHGTQAPVFSCPLSRVCARMRMRSGCVRMRSNTRFLGCHGCQTSYYMTLLTFIDTSPWHTSGTHTN